MTLNMRNKMTNSFSPEVTSFFSSSKCTKTRFCDQFKLMFKIKSSGLYRLFTVFVYKHVPLYVTLLRPTANGPETGAINFDSVFLVNLLPVSMAHALCKSGTTFVWYQILVSISD